MTALTSVRVVEGEARLFGEFDLIAKLGRGGMAEAFLAAKRAKPAELVVVKRLTPDFADDVDHRLMLEEEARIMPLFSHPNVVRTVEVGEQDGQAYLAMEFLDGLPLDQCADAIMPLGEPAALHIACELLDGLHYVHELRDADGVPLDIVHRDVSPHNVFVTYEGRVTLVDFGIAKSRGRAKYTSTGVVRGKLAYMAPEQALCDEVDRRSDVFAVAVILWELLHRRSYWEGLGDVQILKRMTFGDLPGVDAEITGPLRDVLQKALAVKPNERYATARAMRADLVKLKSSTLSRKELGRAVADAAAGYRDALKAVVDAHLVSARGTEGLVGVDPNAKHDSPVFDAAEPPPSERGPSGAAQVPSAEAAQASGERAPLDAKASEPVPSAPRGFTETGGASSLDVPPRGRPRRGVPWGVAAAMVVGVGAVAIFALTRGGGSRETPEAARATTAAAPATQTGPGTGNLVTFELDVQPADARVFLDEMAITEMPFSAKLERDSKAHALRVEAAGYVPQSKIVVLDKDVKLTIALELEPKELRDPAGRTAPDRPATSARRPTSPSATSAPAAPKPSATSVVDKRPPWGNKK